ncbi:MAG: hypothetical protein FWD47_07815 [Treponema sp.]|nr:hypothetical protein [Treponema sp.]
MNIKRKILICIISLVLAVFIPIFVFNTRAPVLIVFEESFILIYGQKRLDNDISRISFNSFRPVKTVIIANDSGDDIIPYAIAEISLRPYCVVFPLRFKNAAFFYREQNPAARVIILEGRGSIEENHSILNPDSGFFIYRTDIDSDFYKAGYAAAAFDNDRKGTIAVFLYPDNEQAKNAFIRGVTSENNPPQVRFYTSFSDFSENTGTTCVVLCGAGYEYLEEKTDIPIIAFTWLDPLLTPENVTIIFDDSPLALLNRALSMIATGEEKGVISSNLTILNKTSIAREILQKIKILQ